MQNKNNSTTKYPLATAGKRIIAKALDIVMISIIVMSLGFAIFCTDPNFAWNQPLSLAQPWRYGLFVTLMAVIFFGLMLLLPRLWNKTLGMKALGLRYYKKADVNYAFGIFKHELFVWEIVVFIALIMGWTLSFLNPDQINSLFEGANAIFSKTPAEGLDKVCYYVGTGFSCFYGVSILFLIAIIIATCIKNHKPAFHDKYSNIYVIYVKQVEKYQPYNSHKVVDVKAPGELSADSLEEIDNI
ncbi:MAG: RDD family protein [Mycoplasma sp.]|nr:RDD family protein [Candidatus Hennigella equi]